MDVPSGRARPVAGTGGWVDHLGSLGAALPELAARRRQLDRRQDHRRSRSLRARRHQASHGDEPAALEPTSAERLWDSDLREQRIDMPIANMMRIRYHIDNGYGNT